MAPPITREAPGPRGWPWIGSLPGFAHDPLRFWTRLAARHGAVARYRIGAESQFLISDPELIGRVLQQDNVRYYRGKYHQLLKSAFGEGLLTSNGESWAWQRRLLQPTFTKNRVAAWLDIVVSTTEARIATWNARVEAPPLDIAREMAGLVQEINAKILFGRTLPYASNEPLLAAVDTINRSLLRQVTREMVLGGVMNRLPLPDTRRYHQAVALLHQTVDRLIAHHRAHEGDDDAIMHGLAQAENAAEIPPSDLPLRDQLITLFLAGHETTACALAWAFYYLSEQPAWAETLGSEADAVLNGGAPTVAALAQLTQTQRVIDESLRLRPPIYGIGRRARTEDDLGGWRIPAESPVVVSPYVMHHHPAYWDHPEQFDPDRFTPSFASGRPRFSYFPFGGGPRTCIGIHLAMMELLTIIALVSRTFRLARPTDRRVEPRAWITLRPHPGVPVRLTRR